MCVYPQTTTPPSSIVHELLVMSSLGPLSLSLSVSLCLSVSVDFHPIHLSPTADPLQAFLNQVHGFQLTSFSDLMPLRALPKKSSTPRRSWSWRDLRLETQKSIPIHGKTFRMSLLDLVGPCRGRSIDRSKGHLNDLSRRGGPGPRPTR